jgi:hypothetical protein
MANGKRTSKGKLSVVTAVATAALATVAGSNGGPTIMEEIAEWKLRADGVIADFKPLAIKAFQHAMPPSMGGHGNCTPLLTLQNAMPKAFRKLAFAAMVAKFSPVKMSNEDKKTGNYTKVELRDPSDKIYRPWNLEGFKEADFFAEDEQVKPFDAERFDIGAQLLKDMRALATQIMGDGKKLKELKTGQTIDDLKVKLKKFHAGYTALVNAKQVTPLEPETTSRIKAALDKEAA